MAGSKSAPALYKSASWLKRKYLVEKMSPEEIGKICNVSHMTIYRFIEKFGLIR